MANQSAGILLFRMINEQLQLFLVHPGGPFWKKKDLGVWSIPKGEYTDAEDALAAARREFQEETGIAVSGDFIKLQPVKQKSGKIIHAWALEGNVDPSTISSNVFTMEWPPGSGKRQQFPEVDKAEWFCVEEAKQKINPAQAALISELQNYIGKPG